jgi:hypothetical protein
MVFPPTLEVQVPVPSPAPTPQYLLQSSTATICGSYSPPTSALLAEREKVSGSSNDVGVVLSGWVTFQKRPRFFWLFGSGLLYYGENENNRPEGHIDIHQYNIHAASKTRVRLTSRVACRTHCVFCLLCRHNGLTLIFHDNQALRCSYAALWKCQYRQLVDSTIQQVISTTYERETIPRQDVDRRRCISETIKTGIPSSMS